MDRVLVDILTAGLLGGVLSVLVAALVSLNWLPRLAERLLAYAVGVLLAFALIRLAPEAVHLGLPPEHVGYGLAFGIVAFFMLEKGILWRHDHSALPALHTCADHASQASAHPQIALVVLGDGLHNFVDGVLIAAAFLVDAALGWTTTLAVLAHELPQEIGDFMVLLAAGVGRARALLLNTLSGLAMVFGALFGYATLAATDGFLPYVLVAAAASFLYLAVADLIPVLHRHNGPSNTVMQFALMLVGMGTVVALGIVLPHSH